MLGLCYKQYQLEAKSTIPLYFFRIPERKVTISPFLYFRPDIGVSDLDDARLMLRSLSDEFGREPWIELLMPRLVDLLTQS